MTIANSPGGEDPSAGTEDLAVLVVDDEVWIAEELALGLEEIGARVKMATSAATAQAVLAEADDIGVVVTDIRMPGEDGLSLVRRLVTNRPALKAVETVVMTGHATIEDAVAAVRAGAFDFVRKPFTLDEMITVVRGALARAAAKRAEARLVLATAHAQAERDASLLVDAVTGLPARTAFTRRLATLAGGSPEARAATAVIAVQLDRVEALRETGGEALADAALTEIGGRLVEASGPDWFVARVGAAEFALAGATGAPTAALTALAERLASAVMRPVVVAGDSLRLTASIGVADGRVVESLGLDEAAALAAGAAKRGGGARVEVFTPAMREAAERRRAILQELPNAIARGQIALHYQPVFRAADRELVGFEALMRWRHPALGPVSPGEFIPVAEDGPLIIELGNWAIEEAARQAAAWQAARPGGIYVAVNISGRQITGSDVPARVARALAEYGLPGSALVAEVTESVALGPKAAAVVAALQEFGLRVALDDFGAGYSSLGVLGSLKVDIVKLDRSLVQGVSSSARERNLFAGLVSTIRALGLAIVVEGIETEAQAQIAQQTGCYALQGYLLGRPLTAAAASALVMKDPDMTAGQPDKS